MLQRPGRRPPSHPQARQAPHLHLAAALLLALIPHPYAAQIAPPASSPPAPGTAAAPGNAVVINEIFYHAPGNLPDLQYVELHNPTPNRIDISGWRFSKGISFNFPTPSALPPGGFAVLCRNLEWFRQFYDINPDGVFEGRLNRGGERIELVDTAGRVIDSVRYSDRAPWPVSPDGASASLERIHAGAPSALPESWAPSTLSPDPKRPSGSPGRTNTAALPSLPPALVGMRTSPSPTALSPGNPLTIDVEPRDTVPLRSVSIVYTLLQGTRESAPVRVAMTPGAGRHSGAIPGQKVHTRIRWHLEAENQQGAIRRLPAANDLPPEFTAFVHTNPTPSSVPWAFILRPDTSEHRFDFGAHLPRFHGRPPEPDPPIHGRDTLVWFDPASPQPRVFDFITVSDRPAGWKIHLHPAQPLADMTTFSLILEGVERFVYAEPLAYDLFRLAGNPASHTDFARLWINDKPFGFHLLVEQPNKAFLRRHGREDRGNLYKILWYEHGLVGQHEKKTNPHTGHEDLETLIPLLKNPNAAEQWDLIRRHFNVEEVITYFAVCSLLSSWDSFFNNYFTYHDTDGTGKWEIYPWDLDKTFGFHDGTGPNGGFHDMPLTFGAAGDSPPGWSRSGPPRNFFESGNVWWRPGGWFSAPLLANPHFKAHYLARIRDLLDSTFNEQRLFPRIDAMQARLRDEIIFRAGLRREDPSRALARFDRTLASIRENIRQRRRWLLAQPEIQGAKAFDRTALK